MLVPVNPEKLKKALSKALDLAPNDKVKVQLAKLHSDLYYANKMMEENVSILQHVLLTPEEIRLVLELIPLEGMALKE